MLLVGQTPFLSLRFLSSQRRRAVNYSLRKLGPNPSAIRDTENDVGVICCVFWILGVNRRTQSGVTYVGDPLGEPHLDLRAREKLRASFNPNDITSRVAI